MTRLMKRLRRRGKRLSPLWRIGFSVQSGLCEIVVIMRVHRLCQQVRARLSRMRHGWPWRRQSYGKPVGVGERGRTDEAAHADR